MKQSLHPLGARCVLTMLFLLISVFGLAQWVKKADALKLRSEVGETIVYNAKLYAFVGFSDTDRHAELSSEVYDPATNTWSYIASMPANTAMTHQDIILVDNTVWHIGGRVGKNPGPLSSAIWIYNIDTNTWSKGPEITDPATGKPLVIAASGSALLGRVLHIFGGFTPTACTNDQDKYHLTLDVDTWLANPGLPAQWENKLKPLPMKRNHLSALTLGGKIYAIGGQTDHDCTTLGKEGPYCHVYNPSTDTWTQLPSLPTGRSHAEGSTFAIDGKIYMAGGQGSDGKSSKYVTIFDPEANNGTGAWTENTSLALPYIYEGCSATVIGNTFIVSHGSQGTSKYPLKATYTQTLARNPVYKLGFPSECLQLKNSSGGTVTGHTWLYTIDGTKNYTTSSNASWLAVTKNATGIAIPNAIDIDVTANTEGLSPGVYNATITATGEAGGINYTAATLCVTLNVQQNATALQYNLAITSNGNGIVNKSPDLENYNDGTPVTLTASPGPGQLFTGWGGSYSGTVNPLQVIMNDNKTVTASFTSSPCNLAVTTIGNGTVSKSPNQTTYPPGSKVTLTATPAAGQQFTGWSGSVTSATSPLSVTMDVSKTITANFAPLQYALIIATSGSGSVITNPAQAAYNSGSTLTLTAIAATGQQFTGWSGSATGTANPLNITMTAAKSVTANFQSQVLITNLSVGSKKAYSVSQLNTGTTHYTDRTYKITSAPAIIDQAPFIKTPNDDRSSKAASLIQFTLTQRALVYIAYDPRAGKIPAWLNGWQKSTATLGITDAVIDHLNLYSKVYPAGKVALGGNMVSPAVGAQSNYLVIAVAQPIQYDLTVLTNGSGTVTKNPNQNAYNAGTIISLTATPAIGQKFTGWSGAASGTANPVAITMNAAKTVTANFSAAQYGLTLSVNGKGSVVKSPDQPDYAGGSTVVLTATSSAGQQFTGWSGSATGSNNPLTITMDDAKAITANFSTIVYDFMISTNGNGRVTKSPDQSTYASGSSVMLTAIPAEGEQFTGWSGSLDASTNPVTITMDADKSVMANFSATEYALLVNTNGNGSVAKSPDQLTYASGSTVTLKATPAPGQHFDGWSGNVSGTNNPLTIIVNEAENITANFSAIQYSLTVNTNGNGSVNRNPDQVMYTAGSSVALMATPRDGYHFTSWSDDAEGADNPITVTVNANKTVTATFDKVSQGRGGSTKNANIENASGIYVPEKQESATGLKIYPNPFHGDRLRLEVFNLPKQQKVNIIISDAFGNIYQNIKEVTDKAGALNRQIVFNKLLSTGLYILNINTGQGSKFIKIIVN